MSSLTSFLKLVKPDRLEGYNVATQNKNLDDIDTGVKTLDARTPLFITGGNNVDSLPAGKRQKVFYGWVSTGTGAGGENKAASLATDGNGVGGLWFGHQGVPTFERIQYVSLGHGSFIEGFVTTWQVMDINASRIKFKGRRLDNSNWANGFGTIQLFVCIVGW